VAVGLGIACLHFMPDFRARGSPTEDDR
jgi:hypothetical protein